MNKRGVSEIVSYVLLVVIALVISSLVFAFLKIYVPKEKPECKEGINVIIESAVCIDHKIKLVVENRGLFTIKAIYVRVGAEGKEFKQWINDPDKSGLPSTDFGFDLKPRNANKRSIPDGDNNFLIIPEGIVNQNSGSDTFVLEIQPAIIEEGKVETYIALCPPISQTITCT